MTTTTARRELHELDEQINRCREEIAAGRAGADDDQRRERDLVLGTLIARRFIVLQWL